MPIDVGLSTENPWQARVAIVPFGPYRDLTVDEIPDEELQRLLLHPWTPFQENLKLALELEDRLRKRRLREIGF